MHWRRNLSTSPGLPMNIHRSTCLLVACFVLLTACSAGHDDRLKSDVGMLKITAPSTASPAPSRPSSRSCPRDYLASLRPEGALPSPNSIPSDSFMGAIRAQQYFVVGVDQNTKLLGYYNPN